MEYLYENRDASDLVITEASQKQLSEGVLAKVKGPSFFIDGYSRNGRFYPRSLWENALKNQETKTTLERGLMFGCIGHPKNYSLDELLESGKVSHKVTNIYIDEKTGEGIAEFEILDTPSGRILNTVLRSGSEMYVSTRAFGGFSNQTKIKDGKKYKILDDSNFVIESIDFVIQPGFLETNPKIVESLMEDFKELKEDKHEIHCVDGLCGLDIFEVNEGENKDNEVNEENNLDKSELENIPKSEIIEMLENVINENKLLSNNEMKNSDEKMISAKLMMNYISYVELLTKLVRYKVEFERYYEDLIEFLDKDSKLTENDMASLKQICEGILKEKDVEESISKVCSRIIELDGKINSAEDYEETEKEDNKDDNKEDNSGVISAKEESAIQFAFSMLEENSKLLSEKKLSEKDLITQLSILKESTIFLTKRLEEELSKEPEVKVEKITETVVEYKIPEDITEKFSKMKTEIESLTEEKENLLTENQSATQTVTEISEKLKITEEEVNELKEEIAQNKVTFKEILEDEEKEKLQLKETINDLEKTTKETSKKVDSLSEELFETKINLYSSDYRLEKKVVKKIMETYDEEREILEALRKEQKILRRSVPIIENQPIPTYRPNEKSSKKAKFLEGLTR